MSESKHTPGPWTTDGCKVVAPGMPKRVWGDNREYSGDYIVCQPSLYVSPKWGSDEMFANAELIASAPQQQAIIDNLRAVLVEQREQVEAANADRARLVAQVAELEQELTKARLTAEEFTAVNTLMSNIGRYGYMISWLMPEPEDDEHYMNLIDAWWERQEAANE